MTQKLMFILTLILLLASSVTSSQAGELNIDEKSQASTQAASLKLDFGYDGELFTNIIANAFVGHPMSLYLSHPNSQNEYKVEVLINLFEHSGKTAAKVYLSFHKKLYDSWENERAIEASLYLNDTSSFSISDASDNHLIEGQLTVSAYSGKLPEGASTSAEYDNLTTMTQ